MQNITSCLLYRRHRRGWRRGRIQPPETSAGGTSTEGMVVKRVPPSTISLKFNIPVDLGAECGSLTPGEWVRSSLSSAGGISCPASGHPAPIPCSGIDPLYSIVRDDSVAVKSLFVRSCSLSASISPPKERPPAAAVTATGRPAAEAAAPAAPPAAPADLWVELDVSGVRPNSCISSDPALLSAWRLLLPKLVTYTLGDAPQRIAPQAAAEDGGLGAQAQEGDKGGSTPGVSGGKKLLEARALEAVFASLKSTSARLGLAEEDAGGAPVAGVGPAPGASGLNAVPAAVVMKGLALFLPWLLYYFISGERVGIACFLRSNHGRVVVCISFCFLALVQILNFRRT